MTHNSWHKLVSVALVFALLFTMLPVQQVFAEEPSENDDFNPVRLDSLVQNERTISTAFYDVDEVYRFSSYVTGGSAGENSIIDFFMPSAGKMSVEIYTASVFSQCLGTGEMKIPLNEKIQPLLSRLAVAYKDPAFIDMARPNEEFVGYLAGSLCDSGTSESIEDLRYESDPALYSMRYFDGSEGHNYIQWTGQYVRVPDEECTYIDEEDVDDEHLAEVASRHPEVATATDVLDEGYYILAFKYEPENDTKQAEIDKREDYNTRFLVIRVIKGSPTTPEADASKENGYSYVVLDPSCGYTTMIRQLAGDPVELSTGSLYWNYTDLEIAGNTPLAFSRTYHSMKTAYDIGLGRGWTYSFYYRINDCRDIILLTLPSGGTLNFTPNNDGSYSTGEGNEYTLFRQSNGYTLFDESGTTINFDGDGRAIKITDLNGKVTSITYDNDGLNTVSNESGTFTFTYSNNHIESVTDELGRSIRYQYETVVDDSANEHTRLIRYTNADGGSIKYSYDDGDNLIGVTNFDEELILTNQYDDYHRVTKQEQPELGIITYSYSNNVHSYSTSKGLTYTIELDELGRTLTQTETFGDTTYRVNYTYDAHNRLASITDRRGGITTYEYDGSSNRQSKITYPDNTSVSYTYDDDGNVTKTVQQNNKELLYVYSNGLLVSSKDAEKNERTYVYNALGHLESSTDALGNVTTYVCNSAGLITQSTDPLGNTTKYEYDEAGRMTAQITPLGNRYTYGYSDGGKLITETDPLGNERTYTYNADGFVRTETDWNGNTTTNSYNVQNHVIEMIDALEHKTTYDYDTDGNLISSTDPESHTVNYTYDAVGRVTSYTDGNGHKTIYSYDANGNMTVSTDPLGYTEKYAYDLMDQAISYTDKRGNTTATTYDKMGRVTSVTDAEGRTTSYTYDANGNTISTTDPNGNTSYCEYDAENKLTKITTAEGNVTVFIYDESGRLIGTTNALGYTTTGIYDADGNVKNETSALGYVTEYEYDALGRVSKKTNPDGSSVSYTYDSNGNILTYTDGNGSTVTYTYDALNHLLTTTTPNGGVITNTYNDDGLLATTKDAEGRVTSYEYDGNHNIASVTDGRGNTTYYTYDVLNRLTGVTDPEGHTMTQVYDENGNLVSIIRPDQGVVSYVYDKANQATSMTDAEGNITTYVYDKNGNLVKETNPLGGVTTYTYDKENNLVKAVSPMGNVTEYVYDSAGQLVATINANGEKTKSKYDADGRLTSVTTALGLVTSYEYDEMGRLTKTINPDGTYTTATYDGNGNRLTFTDARGNTTTYTYDANGNLLTTTDPEGNTTSSSYNKNDEQITYTDQKGGIVSFTYDANGNLASVTDERGYTTSYTYDKNNRQTTTTDRTGAVTAFTYDAQGNVTSVTKPTGGVFTTTYDKNDHVTSYKDALGFTEQRTYDANGNLTSLTDRRGNATRYEYDADDRLIKVIDALGGETTYTYDNIGQIIAITNALGDQTTTNYDADNRPIKDSNELAEAESETHRVRYEYDKMGRITKLINEDGTSESYTHDENGNVLTVTDENGYTTNYTYNKNNQVLTITDPMGGVTVFTYGPTTVVSTETDAMGGVTEYTYDENDNVISIKDPEGFVTSYTYDGEERIATTTDANGNVYRYTYDGNGNLIKVENPDGGIELYAYDLNNQLLSFTDTEGYETTYVYDGNGNLIKVTDPRGNSRISEYDALNRPIALTNEEGGKVTYTYDVMGRVVKAVNEDGAVTEYEYDAKGRTVAIKDAYGNYRLFEYDPMDRVVADTDENGVRRTYEYDAKGNLIKFTDGLSNSETYTYDKNGNQISKTDRNGNTYTYTYDALNRVVSETDPKGNTQYFTYDQNGRIVGVTDRNGNYTEYKLDGNGNIVETIDAAGTSSLYTYDSMNRLTSIKVHRVYTSSSQSIDEWQQTLYTYDHRGLLMSEVNAVGNGKYYVYDENGNLIQEIDEDGYITKYTYNSVNLVSSINYSNQKNVSYIYDGTGDLIEMTDWNGTTTFAIDLLDRISVVTDHNSLVTKYGYDAVGNQTSISYPDGSQVDYWYDAENQIVHMQDFDKGITLFTYDANGNKLSKEYPNYETTYYSYDKCDQVIEMDEHDIHGELQYKTTYSYDPNGNLLTEIQYDFDKKVCDSIGKPRVGKHSLIQDIRLIEETEEVTLALSTSNILLGQASLKTLTVPKANLTGSDFGSNLGGDYQIPESGNTGNLETVTYSLRSTVATDSSENTVGLMRRGREEKPGTPEKPERPPNPGKEEESDSAAVKSQKTYSYDSLNRMTESRENSKTTFYQYDTLGNLVYEKGAGKATYYYYNSLNQLIKKVANGRNYLYAYDKRGNRIMERSRRDSQTYRYDATNSMVHGTNWEGTTSHYVYNGLGVRVNNTVETHGKKLYTREYVVDYTSVEKDDLFVFATALHCLEFTQKHVYAEGERTELLTHSDDTYTCEPTVYVHEDVLGRAHYYSTAAGGKFAELTYDAWGDPDYTNKVIRGDHAEYFYAVFTGHVYDVVLDIYYADARFYDASSRQWMAKDPAKDGLNWYQYCNSNPTTYWDPTGTSWWSDFTDGFVEGCAKILAPVAEPLAVGFDKVYTAAQSFVADPGGYFEKVACDVRIGWITNKNQIISTAVGVGAMVLTTGLAVATGGTSMLVIGMAVGAFQSGLDSYLNQRNSGFAVDWGTVGRESLKGGVISGIAGGIGGAAANSLSPLKFCGKGAMEIAGDVVEHWAVGTMGDAAAGMVTTYVSERFDGKSPQEAFQSTMSSADDILINAAVTSAAGTMFDAVTAPKCFVAGTMITTISGLKAIETIEAGDVVLAANEETGEVAYKEVVRTFVNTTDEITHVTIENAEGEQETIDSTPEHPFYVEGLGWVEASSLHAGMTIWFANGTKGTVEDISNQGLEEPVTVYNFEVADFHTYFVGGSSVLVHNVCGSTADFNNENGKVWDYSNRFEGELANFNDGYEIRTVVDEDMYLVQYHSDAEVGQGRSLKFWTTTDEANGIATVDDYMDKMALLTDWGARDNVSVAKIPAGTEVTYAVGTARAQTNGIESRPGGGTQLLFEQFNDAWVLNTRQLP